jgi:N-terminal domain of reverse transcriptase
MERIKTGLRSIGGRTYGRPDERINPSDAGRIRPARLLAIRQVTQLNTGKKTAGIDGKASLTIEERFTLGMRIK